MNHHGNPEEHGGSGPAEPAAGDHEVNPADDPGPRGNPEPDPERVEQVEEDLDRTESH